MKLRVRDKTYHLEIHQHEDLPLLVLMHGFMGSGQVFQHLLSGLQEFVNPVTIDLLGHGVTDGDAPPERYSVNEQLEDLFIIIRSFHPDPVFLHGYSMGGRLALHYALFRPDTISGLILESTTYGIDNDDELSRRRILDEQCASAIKADFNWFLNAWVKLPLFDNGLSVSALLNARYKEIQQNQNPLSMASSLRGFGTGFMPSVKQDLNKLKIPVLLLAGEVDDKYYKLAEEMHRAIPDSKISIIEHAGHRIHLENPEAFVSELEAFVK